MTKKEQRRQLYKALDEFVQKVGDLGAMDFMEITFIVDRELFPPRRRKYVDHNGYAASHPVYIKGDLECQLCVYERVPDEWDREA